jgi:hypothetical protein
MRDEKPRERFQWPALCEYATESWKLALILRSMFGERLLKNCVGTNANFFRSPEWATWHQVPTETREALEQFSQDKLRKLIEILQPRNIVVIGLSTLDRFGSTVPILTSSQGRTLMRSAKIGGREAVSTLHLSSRRVKITSEERLAIASEIKRRVGIAE